MFTDSRTFNLMPGNSNVNSFKILQLCAIFTPAITLISLVVRTFLNPCTPFLPGYFILPECSQVATEDTTQQPSTWITWTVLRALMCVFVYFSLIDAVCFYCIVAFQYLLVQVHCLRSHLKKFRDAIEVQLQPRRGPSQLDLTVYRELQILTTLYNRIHSDSVMVCAVNYAIFALVLCLYALISERAGLTYLQTIILVCISFDGGLLITVSFRGMAKLYSESVELKRLIDSQLVMAQRSKYNRRMVKMYSRSLKLLMIRVGTAFFFDRITTFIILNFCITALVNMLLVV